MRHFYRSSLTPADAIGAADSFFAELGMTARSTGPRERVYSGDLGAATLAVRAEGGHYTLVEVKTDQMGESRLDRNVKRFFVTLHRAANPAHQLEAAY
jgi:hypothetical protein